MRSLMTVALLGVFLQPSLAGEVFTPDGYSDFLSPGAIEVAKPMDVIKGELASFPESLESGSIRLEVKSYLDRGDRLVVDITQTGLLDDSIEGINRQFKFIGLDDGKYELWGYGYRHRCARGDVDDEWVTKPCP